MRVRCLRSIQGGWRSSVRCSHDRSRGFNREDGLGWTPLIDPRAMTAGPADRTERAAPGRWRGVRNAGRVVSATQSPGCLIRSTMCSTSLSCDASHAGALGARAGTVGRHEPPALSASGSGIASSGSDGRRLRCRCSPARAGGRLRVCGQRSALGYPRVQGPMFAGRGSARPVDCRDGAGVGPSRWARPAPQLGRPGSRTPCWT